MWGWWLLLPLFAASVSATITIYQKVIKPVTHGVSILIDYAEFLQNEVTGSDESLKGKLTSLSSQVCVNTDALNELTSGQADLVVTLDGLKEQVDGMDTTWSMWVFSHAREHAEIWAILARLGYDQRHTDDHLEPPVYPSRGNPKDT